MNVRIVLKVLSVFIFQVSFSQEESILVTESTISLDLDQTKELFFSFAEGDKIVFDMDMIKVQHIKNIEVIELPSNSVFSEFKASEIKNKKIQIHKKGVYKFKFYSSSITRRVCKIKLDRIPVSKETRKFNTQWKWKTIRDTVYTEYNVDSLTGYKTVKIKNTVKELIKNDTIFIEVLSRNERVHSRTAIGKEPYSYINVYLPQNQYNPSFQTPYESTENIAWSYWLGVGERSKKEYEEMNTNFTNGINVLGELTGYGALASLAITGVSMFNDTSIGDNVNYKFIALYDGVERVFVNGNGISSSGRNTNLLQGGYTVELYNDNLKDGINVGVKIIVAQVHKVWKDIVYIEEVQEPQYISLTKTRMAVNETKIRIPAD